MLKRGVGARIRGFELRITKKSTFVIILSLKMVSTIVYFSILNVSSEGIISLSVLSSTVKRFCSRDVKVS